MPDEPHKIFDLMDSETEPTDEQLAELMHYVGEDIRAESARIKKRQRMEIPQAEGLPEHPLHLNNHPRRLFLLSGRQSRTFQPEPQTDPRRFAKNP
jgi:hypothetical protein